MTRNKRFVLLVFYLFLSFPLISCGGSSSDEPLDDNAPPVVHQELPVSDDIWVEPNRKITAVIQDGINEDLTDSLDYSSVNRSTFTVFEKDSGTPVSGDVTVYLYDQWGLGFTHNTYKARFTPIPSFLTNTEYTVKLTTGIRDRKGNHNENEVTWNFTTGPEGFGTWKPMATGSDFDIQGFSSLWTGTELIICCSDNPPGAIYNLEKDEWRPLPSENANVSYGSHMVWTGEELIVWKGTSLDGEGGGSIYSLADNVWRSMTTQGAPDIGGSEAWDGKNLLVMTSSSLYRYSPETDTWSQSELPVDWSRPVPARVLWTGEKFIYWSTPEDFDDMNYPWWGVIYDPSNNSWSRISDLNAPERRSGYSMVWTGGEFILWGGSLYLGIINNYHTYEYKNTGSRYNPSTGIWTDMSTEGIFPGRSGHMAFWTGTHMMVWGGTHNGLYNYYGALYDPETNTWTPTSTFGAPEPAYARTGIWTGNELLIWGHMNNGYTGGIYIPPN